LAPTRGKGTQEFSQFTTFPMAMAPHFGRLVCRSLILMWLHLDQPSPFSVLEFGAGSGQLAWDVRQCSTGNHLGFDARTARLWKQALRYQIVERSPALAERQREKGHAVVMADAQLPTACEDIRRAAGSPTVGAVISNELLDAFAPAKLRYNVYQNDTLACTSWQEVKVLHIARKRELLELLATAIDAEPAAQFVQALVESTYQFACEVVDSSIGKVAMDLVHDMGLGEGADCVMVLLALARLSDHTDLQLPLAAHNMRWRLKNDEEVKGRFQDIVRAEIHWLGEPSNLLIVQREQYKSLRRGLYGVGSSSIMNEVPFINVFESRKIGTSLSQERCQAFMPWIKRNRARIDRTVDLYGHIGYASVEFVLRPGEEKFVELANCILPQGYILSVDYGASFDALSHSTAGGGTDGVVTSLMPVPDGFPDCHTEWMKCPGLVDWTSFVDFTNMADAGEELGWSRDFYGPQNALEQIANTTVISRGTRVLVPGYFVLGHASARERHVVGWYGKELPEHQRWTGFKVLIQQKGAPAQKLIAQPSWHLDVTELDECVSMDFTDLPVADTMWRHLQRGVEPREMLASQTEKASAAMEEG
jgi:SAM-dependent MidA family methyltransferase